MSQVQIAERAGIAPRTIIYWEANTFEPRLNELQAALAAMSATEAEQTEAVSLLTATRGLRKSQETAKAAMPDYLGALPGLGDFLRTLRTRSGQPAAQIADALGVHLTTLHRWEREESLPVEDNLLRLGTTLAATPDEIALLQNWRLHSLAEKSPCALDGLIPQVEAFEARVHSLNPGLIDLQALLLRRQLWPLAAQNVEAQRQMALLDTAYALWLVHQSRFEEAARCAGRALDTAAANFPPEFFWTTAINILAIRAVERPVRAPEEGYRLYRAHYTAFTDPQQRRQMLVCMAEYASQADRNDRAMALLSDAEDIAATQDDPEADVQCAMQRSRIYTRSGLFHEALPLLPTPSPHGPFRLLHTHIWANALLEAGERDEGQRYLDQLYTLARQYGSSLALSRADALARRL